MEKYLSPKRNRGDKDPYGLSDRLKLYGNDIEVYDIDNKDNIFVSCRSSVIKNIVEFKCGEIKEGIYRAPLTMIGQISQLYFSVYPAYLCYVVCLDNNIPSWSYIVVPVNFAAVNKTGGAIKHMSEYNFQKNIFSPHSGNPSSELLQEKPKINKIELFSSEYGPSFPWVYSSFEAVENIVKKVRYDKKNNIPFSFYEEGISELLEDPAIFEAWNIGKNIYFSNKETQDIE